MIDQLTAIYKMVYEIIYQLASEIDITNSLDEIAGLLCIILLLMIAGRIRKRRKNKRPGLDIPDIPQQEEPVDTIETIDSDTTIERISDKIDKHDHIAETVLDEKPEAIAPWAEKPVPEPEPIKTVPELSIEMPAEPAGFFNRLKSGLSKTRLSLSKRFDAILSGNRKIDDEVLEEIEEALITSDIGVPTTMELIGRISKNAGNISSIDDFKTQLKTEMLSLVDLEYPEKVPAKPHVIMVVGVNGVGKTTTIGKLAAKFTAEGKKVLLAAADTFRAAAVEQLEIWAQRAGADIVKHQDKSDPAAVAFDSIEAAIARDIDVVIVDTAGRLHTKVNLMEQLKKIKRSIRKKLPLAPHDILLVLDATTGQNAVSQARLFNQDINISGIVLTKLDGTAKGGIVLSICNSLNVPIQYIGIGEKIDDLQEFDPKLFIDALL
ncbi:MAG: signal recognition particle-docking protein FtsY [Dissulfuribacterales bacterium]